MNTNIGSATELVSYEFKSKRGVIKISLEDVAENPKFRIQGPKEIISKAIAGIGEENETEAWATEENLKTEAQRMYAILEAVKLLNEEFEN